VAAAVQRLHVPEAPHGAGQLGRAGSPGSSGRTLVARDAFRFAGETNRAVGVGLLSRRPYDRSKRSDPACRRIDPHRHTERPRWRRPDPPRAPVHARTRRVPSPVGAGRGARSAGWKRSDCRPASEVRGRSAGEHYGGEHLARA
jgi:hypothetical protein